MQAKPAPKPPAGPVQGELREALGKPRRHYAQATRLSLVVGVLMLAPSWFMFEVYGRVLNSRNEATLAWLLLAAVGIYVVLELLDVARLRALARAGDEVSAALTPRVFDASFTAMLRRIPGGNAQGLSDLRTVTDFIQSSAVTAVLDLPAALLCLLLLSLMSPWLGVLALVAAAAQVAIGYFQERKSARPYGEANQAAAEAQLRAAGVFRNAQVIRAMGMEPAMHQRWTGSQRRFMLALGQASDKAGAGSAMTKFVVTTQSSLLLGLACWLALQNSLLGGPAMAIVASILGGRVLAPMAQLIGQWRAIGNARSAYTRLAALLENVPKEAPGMALPPPKGALLADNVVITPPGAPAPVIQGMSFGALPGEMLTIIGPSAAGKSTLARALIGVWPSIGGKVRLDGADVYTWHKSLLGPHVGYLPQTVELFDGTVAENIARFGSVDRAAVQAACEEVGIADFVDALPQGMDTPIGDDGANLSGGQRQRIGLARAVYGKPHLIVLDEPNSSLDDAGEKALLQLIAGLKQRGATVISITHRTSILQAADKVLLMNDGKVASFGPRDDVLGALKAANERLQNKAAPARPAGTAAPAGAAAAAPGQPQPARPAAALPGPAALSNPFGQTRGGLA